MSVSSDLRLIGDMAYRLSDAAKPGLLGLPHSSVYSKLTRLRKLVEQLERNAIREINSVGFDVIGELEGESPLPTMESPVRAHRGCWSDSSFGDGSAERKLK